VSPVLAALLFHAPGVRLLARRRLSPLAFRLNLVALGLTGLVMALAGLRWGLTGVVAGWAVGHGLWSVTLAALVHRGVGTRHDGGA
jgi:hypothetical protein